MAMNAEHPRVTDVVQTEFTQLFRFPMQKASTNAAGNGTIAMSADRRDPPARTATAYAAGIIRITIGDLVVTARYANIPTATVTVQAHAAKKAFCV